MIGAARCRSSADRPADAHHVGQREHDDVGVRRREPDRDRGQPEQEPAAPVDRLPRGVGRGHGFVMSLRVP